MFTLVLDSFQHTITIYDFRDIFQGLFAADGCSFCCYILLRSEQVIFLLSNVGYEAICKTLKI